MSSVTELWQALRRHRRLQRFWGGCSAVLLATALLGLLDGVQALMRLGSDHLEMLPGASETISGPCPFKNPLSSDIEARFTPENAPLYFSLEGFFAGYWFGNGMWRGEVRAEPDAGPGRYALRVVFKGAAAQSAQKYVVALWPDEASRRAASPSWIRRVTGWNAFITAALFGCLGILCGLGTYLLGRRCFRLLAALGCAEVFRVSAGGAPRRIWCLASAPGAPRPGDVRPVLDDAGQPLGDARAEKAHKGVLELVMLDNASVLPGCLVCLRPDVVSRPQAGGRD
ncbi:hypothetical protein [Desulfovibrio sp. SGI.169]|uniref:hypothetical protein n=1 Tax=Desulfovibrio sp. SGI.169 TaxID=3420561 RepID=UPI003D005E33